MLLWDVRTGAVVHQFRGHQSPITALARRRDGDGPELYSASSDRTARVWDLEQRGYVETLYGHQEPLTALDALCDHHLVSASADRTVRLWKVAEEVQLIFSSAHTAPVDCVAMLHAEGFVSGSQVRRRRRSPGAHAARGANRRHVSCPPAPPHLT